MAKIAFVKGTKTWHVWCPKAGWTAPDGSQPSVPAGSTFFKTLKDATDAGFKPSPKQAEIIASWDPKPTMGPKINKD